MTEDNDYSREDVISYINSWKESLELRRREIYSKYLSGAMGGVLLIVVTIGLSFDKLERFGLFEKLLLGSSLVLLIMAVGNTMHGITFTTNAQLQLLQVERNILLEQKSHVDRDQMASLEQSLTSGRDEAHQYFPYSYWCIVLAVLLGVIGFFTILVRA